MIVIQLQKIAEAQGLTLSQVQRRSGLTMLLVRRYWYNTTSSVTLDAINMLCELLHVGPGDLLCNKCSRGDRKT